MALACDYLTPIASVVEGVTPFTLVKGSSPLAKSDYFSESPEINQSSSATSTTFEAVIHFLLQNRTCKFNELEVVEVFILFHFRLSCIFHFL